MSVKTQDIYDVLVSARNRLIAVGDAVAVDFTLADINILSDPNQLRKLKLRTPFPADFENSRDIGECASRVFEDEGIYRVLEYCMLKNRVIVPHVTKVFERLKR